ncbi:hypothetical protein AVEN_250765-1 [Araneus ventricosus]|uniref:Uncharacterized protein n=1 Tax=Araneus ventricosus TaxID=182803 RepID=A0A4Y2UMM3_ARAVE|nr:hypothetical protein AVEN_250765-1 [Araneus ventricosus]
MISPFFFSFEPSQDGQRPRWLSGKVSVSEPQGSKPDSTKDPSRIGPVARQIIRRLGGQTSSRWCGAKIPTLARPTQEGCKAGRGPVGKEPPHQHVEDWIYYVQ